MKLRKNSTAQHNLPWMNKSIYPKSHRYMFVHLRYISLNLGLTRNIVYDSQWQQTATKFSLPPSMQPSWLFKQQSAG